jgi:hypothetical protein
VVDNLVDIESLSISELEQFIRECRTSISILRSQIDPPSAARWRTLKIVRATLLTVGGFIGATFDWMALILVAVGTWDWLEEFVEDAREMNKNNELIERAIEFDRQLNAAEARLRALRAGG